MLYYPHLAAALDKYTRFLQFSYKTNVQKRTGRLYESIHVWCEWEGQHYSLHFSMRPWWKWIKGVFRVDKAQQTAGVPVDYPKFYKGTWDDGTRYPINWQEWQNYLNQAFEEDIRDNLNGVFE